MMHAPLDFAEKMRLGGFIIRMAIGNRDKLARELIEAIRHVIHRLRLRVSESIKALRN
jgi:hypothetical protein